MKKYLHTAECFCEL